MYLLIRSIGTQPVSSNDNVLALNQHSRLTMFVKNWTPGFVQLSSDLVHDESYPDLYTAGCFVLVPVVSERLEFFNAELLFAYR